MGQYQAAIQNPKHVFSDPDLQQATVEMTQLGTPRPRSGGFAVTYKMSKAGNSWAVRCFHREVHDRRERYQAISKFLAPQSGGEFAEFSFQDRGILIDNQQYPIVKMAWVDGPTLGNYVAQHVHDASVLSSIEAGFRRLLNRTEQLQIAHGDLQHGNVIVEQGKVRLVDYDGMFVPGMQPVRSAELGHVNYQSPLRTEEDFGPGVDRFSGVVISLALQAIRERPDLWDTYSTGENLLFQRSDFVDPEGSPLLADLRSIPKIAPLVDQFALLCRLPITHIPTVDDFLNQRLVIDASGTVSLVGSRIRLRQYDALEAVAVQDLIAREGDVIEVVGFVTNAEFKEARGGQPYAMIDFGNWRQGCFRLILWSEALDLLKEEGRNLNEYRGEWVSVAGLMQTWQSWNNLVPQIIVNAPTEINVLAGEREARKILREAKADYVVTQSVEQPVQDRNSVIRAKLGTMAAVTPAVADTIRSGGERVSQNVAAAAPQSSPAPAIEQKSLNQTLRDRLRIFGRKGPAE
jgi:hypothetical protein